MALRQLDLFKICAASSEDSNIQITNLESKVAAQTKEIETHIEAIAQLENQKLDLTQGICLKYLFFFTTILFY